MIGFGPALARPARSGTARTTTSASLGVVGGGLAGLAAATVAAERGVSVTVWERESYLGGRVGSWPTVIADGSELWMERGFHAFFRQYYNLRRLMRRFDPGLTRLIPLDDYPVVGPGGITESFQALPKLAPFNLIELVRRTPHISLRSLTKVNVSAAMEMVSFDHDATYKRLDDLSAADYLKSLNFPAAAKRMLFDVFAHSFFNPEEEMSAAELVMMFHFYFTGNPEGLVFDVLDDAFEHAFIGPWRRHLEALGVEFKLSSPVESLTRHDDGRFEVMSDGDVTSVDQVVVSVDVPSLDSVLGDSSVAAAREHIAKCGVTAPFVVWRLWLDRPSAPGRQPFIGTAGLGRLDNISLYQLFERESRDWAARTGGSVVELHGYGLTGPTDEEDIKSEYLSALHTLYPETRDATIIDERYILSQDCPSFPPAGHRDRPTVGTAVPGLYLAGDLVSLPFPSALMERASSSGILAANLALERLGVASEPLYSVPARGLATGIWPSRPLASLAAAVRRS